MKLFLITLEEGGDNFDLFVIAEDRDQAVSIWEKWEFLECFFETPPEPANVFVLPVVISAKVSAGGCRSLDWEDLRVSP